MKAGKILYLDSFIHSIFLFFYYFLFSEQDEGLEALSKVISRQKEIANTINSEVDHQNGEYR